jgi:undecaprenyl-diphosphatase
VLDRWRREHDRAAADLTTAGGLILVWASLLLAGSAAGSVLTDNNPSWDSSVVSDLHGGPGTSVTELMRAITWLGSSVWLNIVFFVALAALLWRRTWRKLLFLILASPGTVLLVQIIKTVVDRHRPLEHHLTSASGPSFPSGHASSSAALYGALLLLWLDADRTSGPRARRAAQFVMAMVLGLIGFSRVYLGVHYPSDVIAAWLLVMIWLATLHHVIIRRAES